MAYTPNQYSPGWKHGTPHLEETEWVITNKAKYDSTPRKLSIVHYRFSEEARARTFLTDESQVPWFHWLDDEDFIAWVEHNRGNSHRCGILLGVDWDRDQR